MAPIGTECELLKGNVLSRGIRSEVSRESRESLVEDTPENSLEALMVCSKLGVAK